MGESCRCRATNAATLSSLISFLSEAGRGAAAAGRAQRAVPGYECGNLVTSCLIDSPLQ